MYRRTIVVFTTAALVFATGCSQQQETKSDPAGEAFQEVREAILDGAPDSDLAAIAEKMLDQFPESRYSGFLSQVVVDYHLKDNDDAETAYRIVHGALDAIEDPETRFEVGLALLPAATELDRSPDLDSLVEELAANRELKYSDYVQIMESAAANELWPATERHANATLKMSSEKAYRADYPDRELDDATVAERARSRRAMALAHKGWALANTDRSAEGIPMLEKAAELSSRSYVGVAVTPAPTYLGRALLAQGDTEGAMQILAADAVFGDPESALPALRSSYVAANGSEEGFDEYLWDTRRRLARSVDDFTLADYKGVEHALSDTRGKVVMLAFWFPT